VLNHSGAVKWCELLAEIKVVLPFSTHTGQLLFPDGGQEGRHAIAVQGILAPGLLDSWCAVRCIPPGSPR
jgi:hypothetical protein